MAEARGIDPVEDRTKELALQLLGKLPEDSAAGIQAVAMDMWPAYIEAVEQVLPEAAIVFDKFHIKKYPDEAADKVRRQENRQLKAAATPA